MKRVHEIISVLHAHYPDATTALVYGSPFQLLVAVILSAQCTDARVNIVTPALFARFPGPAEMASGESEEIERLISSINFFRAKARNIRASAELLMREYGGQVPARMEDLVRLPGVARKTANVVLGTAFGIQEGIVVDTHVIRVSGRLGLASLADVKRKNAVRIERDLLEVVPPSQRTLFGHLLVLHGRAICTARKPACGRCAINHFCPSAFKV